MLRNKLVDNKGNAMLLVVVLMSVLFMLVTIVFGYAVRDFRYSRETIDVVVGGVQRDTALADALSEICARLDEGTSIGTFTMSKSSLNSDSDLSYVVTVYEDGSYDSDEFQMTTNHKIYYYSRNLIESEGEEEEEESGEEEEEPGKDNKGVVKAEDYDVFDVDGNKIMYKKGIIVIYEDDYYVALKTIIYRGDADDVPGVNDRLWTLADEDGNPIYPISEENIAVLIITENDGYTFERKVIIDVNSDNVVNYTVDVYKAY